MTTAEYLHDAYCVATQSKDSSNQNGAVLVDASGQKLIGTGVNNFPIGVAFTKERSEERPTKYRYFEHAERNAIYQAARAGEKVFGSTMYVPWAACCDCARGIINSGVRTVVMHEQRMQMTPERWKASVDEALSMMKEAGVRLEYFDGGIEGAPLLLVNGQQWNPAQEVLADGGGTSMVEMGEER